MDIILACEESQEVTIALRQKGHNAFSCDLQKCSGGHSEWHIMEDVLKVIHGGSFKTESGDKVQIQIWNMMIAFPPCTHLAISGASSMPEKIADGRQQKAIDFFMDLWNAPIEQIGIENPVGVMSTIFRQPDQIVHPYYFGDPHEKRTCLWLKNLPLLYHNERPNLFDPVQTWVQPEERYQWISSKTGKKKSQPKWYAFASQKKGERAKVRSKTFSGIAKAMSDQWT